MTSSKGRPFWITNCLTVSQVFDLFSPLSSIYLNGQEKVTFETHLSLDLLYLHWRWNDHSDTAGSESARFYQITQQNSSKFF